MELGDEMARIGGKIKQRGHGSYGSWTQSINLINLYIDHAVASSFPGESKSRHGEVSTGCIGCIGLGLGFASHRTKHGNASTRSTFALVLQPPIRNHQPHGGTTWKMSHVGRLRCLFLLITHRRVFLVARALLSSILSRTF